MKLFLNILLILASAILLVCFCFCVPSALYGGGAETLFAFNGFRLTVFGIGAGIAMLITLVLAGLCLKYQNRTLSDTLFLAILGIPLAWLAGKAAYILSTLGQAPTKEILLPQNGGIHVFGAAAGLVLAGILVSLFRKTGIGKMMNAVGLGLLPGLAAACIFRSFPAGQNLFVWVVPFTGGTVTLSIFLAEAALLFAAFTAMMLWLIFRRAPLPENSDLLLVSLSLYGTVRLLSLMFSAAISGSPVMWGWRPLALAFILLLVPLIVWSVRFRHSDLKRTYIPLCWLVFLAAGAGIILRFAGKWSVPVEAVDSAATIALILLILKPVCCMGRVSRKLFQPAVSENDVPQPYTAC